MPTATANGIDLCYEIMGDDDGVPLLLVMGLGAQLIAWDEGFCLSLVDRGFRVIRFDNRDVGLSTKVDVGDLDVMANLLASFGGEAVHAPYLLADMADDAAALLDLLGVPAAHVVGASMGGMIAQTIAIRHPEKVLTLTSIMSTTGDPDVGQPRPDVLPILLQAPPAGRDEAIEAGVASSKAISSPELFDPAVAATKAAAAYDRSFYPAGVGHQLLAIVASGSRSEALAQLDIPALVVHGDADPLITPSGGERTAEVIPGAELLMLEGMGHDLPMVLWPQIVEAITQLAGRVPVTGQVA